MYVVVDITGGQGFLPDELKDNAVLQQAFAQDIIDRYCDTEYFDHEFLEDYEIPSLWHLLKLWLRACPLLTILIQNKKQEVPDNEIDNETL